MEYWLYRTLMVIGLFIGIRIVASLIWYLFPPGKLRDALFRVR